MNFYLFIKIKTVIELNIFDKKFGFSDFFGVHSNSNQTVRHRTEVLHLKVFSQKSTRKTQKQKTKLTVFLELVL